MKDLKVKKRVEDWFDSSAMYAAKRLLPRNEKLVYIAPDDFLKLSSSFKNPKGHDPNKLPGVQKLINQGIPFDSLPYLRVKQAFKLNSDWSEEEIPNTGEIWGHEGRHRVMSLKKLGWKQVPVIIKFQDINKVPLWIVNQDGNKTFRWQQVIKPYRG